MGPLPLGENGRPGRRLRAHAYRSWDAVTEVVTVKGPGRLISHDASRMHTDRLRALAEKQKSEVMDCHAREFFK